ncbi:MAG TPA: cytochrome c oxidase subunit I [Candidatus Sumerlaeota bacterium]|nr:cytochrome c oxidase subunit I [Candidatus Sumerlaeota bacterium]HPK01403.1 cytochrome c oxidase subunit I [Candidatus Sumerlaeota bacterium]
MSTATLPGPIPHDHDVGRINYLHSHRGVMSWVYTLDHKRIGIMYLAAVTASFLVGGVMALLIRAELIDPQLTMLPSNKVYNQLFTLHGAIMVFLFIIPSIPAALGNFFLPIMLGAKDVAFPRLNLASFYIYVVGAIFAVISIVLGSVDTGWTFYTPYSVDTQTSVVMMTMGAFILGFSSIFTGLNFIVTVHKLRAPGLTWFRMPLFVWALYATSIIQVLATPVLGITLLLLAIERVAHVGIFDPLMGGDPVLFQHFFWFYSHPAVYIMIVPGMGIISEIIPTFARKPIFGYRFIAFSSIAIALIGFLVWGHHMFTSGQSEIAVMIFSALTFLVSIPSAIKVFNWTATLYRGSIDLKTPMLYALSFIFLFTIGGLTGLFLGALATDIHLHDTYFIVAHFHYVMVGGTVMAFMGGLHYWWPKMTGRMYPELLGQITCGIVFLGFNMTFFTQFILGSQGMPRRYATYDEQFQPLHAFSSVGALVLGVGFAITTAYLLWSLWKGAKAPRNPWGSLSLEWQIETPPIHQNFLETPVIEGMPYDYGVETGGGH